MKKTDPAPVPRILSGRMVPYETAREAVCTSCPNVDINGWLTSFASLLVCAANTTWDPADVGDVVAVLEGLTHAIQSLGRERFGEAMKMLEEVQS